MPRYGGGGYRTTYRPTYRTYTRPTYRTTYRPTYRTYTRPAYYSSSTWIQPWFCIKYFFVFKYYNYYL